MKKSVIIRDNRVTIVFRPNFWEWMLMRKTVKAVFVRGYGQEWISLSKAAVRVSSLIKLLKLTRKDIKTINSIKCLNL